MTHSDEGLLGDSGVPGSLEQGLPGGGDPVKGGVSLRLSNSHEQRPWGQGPRPPGVAGQRGARSDFHRPGSSGPWEHPLSARSLPTLGA